LPSKRSDVGHQRVFQRSQVISIPQEYVENKRDVDGKPSRFKGEVEPVLIIDLFVEIRFRGQNCFIGRLAV
jgi:hypothetical protein